MDIKISPEDVLNFYRETGQDPWRKDLILEWKKSKEPKKEYEILSFYISSRFGKFTADFICPKSGEVFTDGFNKFTEEECFSFEDFKIHSVKRLSDGEVFTVGDKLKDLGTIHSFFTYGPRRNAILFRTSPGTMYGYTLEHTEKAPTYNFKTEDGVAITDGTQVLFAVLAKENWQTGTDTLKRMNQRSHIKQLSNAWKYFSTEKARDEYILMNRPVHSVNDILAMFQHNTNLSLYKDALITVSKQKLWNQTK